MIKRIEENAGRIWKILAEFGQLSPGALKKMTRLDDKDIYLALGWLARENKLHMQEKRKQLLLCLKLE